MQEQATDPLTTATGQRPGQSRRPSLRRSAALVAALLLVALGADVLFGEQRAELSRLEQQVAALKRQVAQ